jgi:hypothetical protein
MSSSAFEKMAKQRYPFTNDNQHNLRMAQLRTDYISALYECKARPAYSILSNCGEFYCSSEPLMPDDTKGWQTVKSDGRTGKKRTSRAHNIDDYDDY